MLEILLPYASSVVAVEVPNPRSLKAAELIDEIRSIREDLEVWTADSVGDAVERIKKPQPEAVADIICGSLYLVGPLRAVIL